MHRHGNFSMIVLRWPLLALLVALSSFGAFASVDSAQFPVSAVRVVVVGPIDVAALVEAELSSAGEFVVLERSALKAIFREWEGGDFSQLGNLAGADYLVAVSPDAKRLSLIDATSGRWLGEVPAANPSAALRELMIRANEPARPTVAVVGDHDLDGLQHWLISEGFQVLDRKQSLQVLGERELGETGFTKTGKRTTPFLGAEFVIVRDAHSLRVFGGNGHLLGEMPIRGANPDGPDEEKLRQLLSGDGATSAVFRQHVATEALKPFYRGIRNFAAGRYPEAAAEFQLAYEASNRFEPAYRWEARCYDAMGLPRLAAAVTRFADLGFYGRGAALGADITPREGLMFLGLDGPEAKSARLSLEAIPALSQRNLFLPESLAVAREQFDLLTRTDHTTGPRWETAGGFVVREGIAGQFLDDGRVRLEFWDLLSGELLGLRTVVAPTTKAEWEAAFDELLNGGIPALRERPSFGQMDQTSAIAALKSAQTNAVRNTALLHLLLSAPDDPATIGTPFIKGSDEKDGLDGFLNHAKRDQLIATLPPEHPMRPWLELERLQSFLPWPGTGQIFSGEPVDAVAELEKFSRADPTHPARAVARYFWLVDQQAKLTPEQLLRETETLRSLLDAHPEIPRHGDLLKLARTWVHLARVVAGLETKKDRPADYHIPERFRLEVARDGIPKVEWNDVAGAFREGFDFYTEAEYKTECAYAIAQQGRGERLLRVSPDWIERFPQCLGLVYFISWGAMQAVAGDLGRPWIHMLHPTPAAEKQHWRNMVEYAQRNLLHYLDKVKSPEHFPLVDRIVNYFVHRLNTRSFRQVVPDDEYAQWHEQLRQASQAAARRAGCADKTTRTWDTNMHDWRTLTREVSARRLANDLGTGPNHFKDFPALQEKERSAFARLASPNARPSDLRAWWRTTDGEIGLWQTPGELAELILARLPFIQERIGSEELFDDDRALLLDCAIVLMQGRNNAVAEELLREVVTVPPSKSSDNSITRALQASAFWHLARILRVDGRKVEAMTALQDCLQKSEGLHVRYLWRVQPDYRGWLLRIPQGASVASLALRTLEEMRFDPARGQLLEGVDFTTVTTRQLNNPELLVFYRRPNSQARAALVLAPSVNESVLPMLEKDSSWVRFADENGLVLVAPQFNGADTHRFSGHAFTAYQNAQCWSGEALLQAMEQIRKEVGFADQRLFLHGYGGGAQFLQSFSRWKPDRVAALSAHSASTWAWLEGIPGQHSLADLRDIPMLFSVGEFDDARLGDTNRRASTAQLVTMLRASGCDARFALLPGAPHRPTPEMEHLAMEFLAENL